ncbi:MAG: CoA ester lyase [Thermoproteota archaeon]|nr:CoA ester lyase [Thermoproteota archaeon]
MRQDMFRSLIFVPSNSERYLNKAKILNADIVCLDLEDSVPYDEKDAARHLIKSALAMRATYQTRNIYVRINSFDSGLAFCDLKAVIQKGIDGIVLPKVSNDDEISAVDRILFTLEQEIGIHEKTIKIAASIESAKGVVNSYSIAKASDRVNMLVFGVFDFLYDMHLDYKEGNNEFEYAYARSKIPVDARAAGIEAIDGIWQKIDDSEGLKRDAALAKRLGYAGKSLIHPSQIETVHEVFIPSKSEIEWATKVVKALDEEKKNGRSKGAMRLEGKMIDAVHYKQAKAILEDVNKNK